MSEDTKQAIALALMFIVVTCGLAYCNHDKSLTERECQKLHSPAECRR